jgi:hypothetical protein
VSVAQQESVTTPDDGRYVHSEPGMSRETPKPSRGVGLVNLCDLSAPDGGRGPSSQILRHR